MNELSKVVLWSQPRQTILLIMIVLQSESPSDNLAKLHTAAANNSRNHQTRSLSSPPLPSTIDCSPDSQALLEVTHRDHSSGALFICLFAALTCRCCIPNTHPARDVSPMQQRAYRVFATIANKR